MARGLGREGVESGDTVLVSKFGVAPSDARPARAGVVFDRDDPVAIVRRGDLVCPIPLVDDVVLVFESRRDRTAKLAEGDIAVLLALLMVESRRARSGLSVDVVMPPALLRREEALRRSPSAVRAACVS